MTMLVLGTPCRPCLPSSYYLQGILLGFNLIFFVYLTSHSVIDSIYKYPGFIFFFSQEFLSFSLCSEENYAKWLPNWTIDQDLVIYVLHLYFFEDFFHTNSNHTLEMMTHSSLERWVLWVIYSFYALQISERTISRIPDAVHENNRHERDVWVSLYQNIKVFLFLLFTNVLIWLTS